MCALQNSPLESKDSIVAVDNVKAYASMLLQFIHATFIQSNNMCLDLLAYPKRD